MIECVTYNETNCACWPYFSLWISREQLYLLLPDHFLFFNVLTGRVSHPFSRWSTLSNNQFPMHARTASSLHFFSFHHACIAAWNSWNSFASEQIQTITLTSFNTARLVNYVYLWPVLIWARNCFHRATIYKSFPIQQSNELKACIARLSCIDHTYEMHK